MEQHDLQDATEELAHTRTQEEQEELVRTRAQLETLRKQYTDLYDTAPVGYYMLDDTGTILDINLTAARWLGGEKSEFVGRPFERYIAEEDVERLTTFFTEMFTTPVSIQLDEVRLKKSDGTLCYARLESHPLPPADDHPKHCRLTVFDMTELRDARNTLLRRDGELALFNRVTQVLSSATDMDQILMLLMEEVRRLLEVTVCSIWLVDPATKELVCRQAIGPHRDTILGWRLQPGQGIAGWVARTGQSLLVNNSVADERHFDGVERVTGQPLNSILCVPMQANQEVIGVVQVLDPEPNRFTDIDQVLQELLAAIVSIALDNAQLHEQVHHDTRTKQFLLSDLNRRIDRMLSSNIRLFSTVRRHAGLRKRAESKALMSNMLVRMKGLKRVYAFLAEFEWNPLPLSELVLRVIQGTLDALPSHKDISVEISSSPVRVSPEQADSLGMIINELVTNTVKHATIGRNDASITVHIAKIGDSVHVEYRDDGPGWPKDVARFDRHHVGVYLLQKFVRKDLDGKLDMYNDNGAVIEIRFKAAAQAIV